MTTLLQSRGALFTLLACSVLFISLSGCSDEAPPQSVQKAEPAKFDHAHGTEVTDLEKHKFEHDFAAQCVARELKNSANPATDRKRLEESCMCIATYLMKDLRADEAKKFLLEHKNTQSLVIRFDNAAYHCLQQKAQIKEPALFGKR